jgi:N-acetylated-alpha-linked acidic dipeptidase
MANFISTTPGYPSKPGVPRAPADESTPSIPSIPISYNDAVPILKALNGVGPKAGDLGAAWTQNNGLTYKGVEYNIGPSPETSVLNLYNQVDYTTTPQWDVIGIINGSIPNEVIIMGNHRDAWIAGGAGDPNSGSTVLNEIVRSFGKAVEQGWKPLRTIVFASWDGEEYGLVGSTEWVEEYLPWIQDANVAYLNVDVAVSGDRLSTRASPALDRVIRDNVFKVPSPNQTVPGQTLGDLWDGRIHALGSGSDFTAFLDYAGIPSLDMGFTSTASSPVYQYHSNYDSFHWMEKFGDPGFTHHVAVTKLFNLMLLDLIDSVVIPFKLSDYVDELDKYLDQIEAKADAASDPASIKSRTSMSPGEVTSNSDAFRSSLAAVRVAIIQLREKALEIDELAAWSERQLQEGIPWWNIVKWVKLSHAIAKVNPRYKYFERNMLFEGGLDGRSWYKHVVYAPGLWTGYDGGKYCLGVSIHAKYRLTIMQTCFLVYQRVSRKRTTEMA